MITCFIRYTIDPDKLTEFEIYAKTWIRLVTKLGGTHHGYLMPSEGTNNIALAFFSFPSFADYEKYRATMATDPECQASMEYYRQTRCYLSYERSFFRPVFS